MCLCTFFFSVNHYVVVMFSYFVVGMSVVFLMLIKWTQGFFILAAEAAE